MKAFLFGLVLLMTQVASADLSAFFHGVDRALPEYSSHSRLVSERFLLLSARISVFAIYCDLANQQGWNTKAYELRQRTTDLQKRAEKDLGGVKPAYNRFERHRNDESVRFKRFDQQRICAENSQSFLQLVRHSGRQHRRLLTDTERGRL